MTGVERVAAPTLEQASALPHSEAEIQVPQDVGAALPAVSHLPAH